MTAIGSSEKKICGVVKRVFIYRRKNKWLRTFGAEFPSVLHDRRNLLNLPGDPVISRHIRAAGTVNNVWIHGIGNGISVLDCPNGMPIAESNFAVVAAAGNAYGAAILLAAANAIGKSVIRNHVINLRGG